MGGPSTGLKFVFQDLRGQRNFNYQVPIPEIIESQTKPDGPIMDEKPKLDNELPKESTPESVTSSPQSLLSIEEQDKILYRQFLALKGYPKKGD